ncbi:MAG: thiamine diphosphokinase [Dehalococcoidia bacterium]
MLAIIVAGGELLLSERVLAIARAAELVIAADSGIRHLAALGRSADVILGDFDSAIPPADSAAAVIRYPVAKDKTDTHIAADEAYRRGANQIRLLGTLRGPRLDHGAANILLLAERRFREIDLRAIDGEDELRAVRRRTTVHGHAGDLVTLLSMSRETTGVTTSELAYPLFNATLRRGQSRGVSNLMLGEQATIDLKAGVLLIVHRNGGDPNVLTQ